ncbi:hypothetical protein F3Y22_tig00113725pilonHSYRG01624 [Hibiscus syriacus]|uniref:RNase H type-1 domain-containing protein n=1 Tax=Hibiscus syriacus TaxID=106335 RepID=A0A6A2Y1K1_HIBSY|nr:hypothetical protein F3Y22_tig00113725pilonHSYRG01624 [Hibiscus syriacus]
MGKYLGTLVLHPGARKDRFLYIIDKIHSRLSGYAARALSFTGRVTLVNGGLGIRQTKDQNTAFLLKRCLALVQSPHSLWVRVLSEIYKMVELYPLSTALPLGWWCLNSDAAISQSAGTGSIGGVIRDHEGSLFLSYAQNIGITIVLQAELWGILDGLKLAKHNNIKYLIVQSDHGDAIKLLSPLDSLCPFPLVRSITLLYEDDWQPNMVANFLSKLGSPHDLFVHAHTFLPNSLGDLLQRDLLDPPYYGVLYVRALASLSF